MTGPGQETKQQGAQYRPDLPPPLPLPRRRRPLRQPVPDNSAPWLSGLRAGVALGGITTGLVVMVLLLWVESTDGFAGFRQIAFLFALPFWLIAVLLTVASLLTAGQWLLSRYPACLSNLLFWLLLLSLSINGYSAMRLLPELG